MSSGLKIQKLPWLVVKEDAQLYRVATTGNAPLTVCTCYSPDVAKMLINRQNEYLRARFARWLESSSWTVAALSEALGVSRQAIYHWLNGSVIPSDENLEKLGRLSGGEVGEDTFSAVAS